MGADRPRLLTHWQCGGAGLESAATAMKTAFKKGQNRAIHCVVVARAAVTVL